MENEFFFKEEKLNGLFKKFGRIYKEGEIIFEENSPPDNFYIIFEGKVKIVLEGIVLNTLGNGEMFGEISLIDRGQHSASAIALTNSKIIVVNEKTFLNIMDDKQAVMNILKTMIQRISRLSDMSAKLLLRKERTRVFVSLTNIIKSSMKTNLNKVILDTVKTVSTISKETKIEEETVIRYLKEMEVNNLIKIEDKDIIINNVMLLRKIDTGQILTD